MNNYFVTSQELENAIEAVLSATQKIIDQLEARIKKLEQKEMERQVHAELKIKLEKIRKAEENKERE